MKKKKKLHTSEVPTQGSPSTTASKPPVDVPPDSLSLADLLKKSYPDVSLTNFRKWIKFKRVQVDGKPGIDLKKFYSKYAQVKLLNKDEPLEEDIKVLFMDNHLIVIDKPEDLLSVASETKKHSAHQILKVKFHPRKISVIHRLDEGTSGVMIFGFSDPAYHNLKDQFKEHSIERVYMALVEGDFPEEKGTWDCYLYEDTAMKMRITKDTKKGERAITHFEKVASNDRYTLMRFTLETGKKNQIRVQASAAGHPIAGDRKYGASSNPINRLALHATTLSFIHPITKKPMTFTSPPPENFITKSKTRTMVKRKKLESLPDET